MKARLAHDPTRSSTRSPRGGEPAPAPIRQNLFPRAAQQPDRALKDITQLYVTFTHPKVVTSMLLLGIVLSLLLRYLAGQWYMPAAFVAICTVTAILYMYWLDRQDWREE